MHCALTEKHCKPCEGGIPSLTADEIMPLATLTPSWTVAKDNKSISRRVEFKGFYKTMGFINAIAWIAQQEQHHPDITFGYDYCQIIYTTHAIDGLSENDFICASKIDQLLSS